MAAGSRVDLLKEFPAFLWRDAPLEDSGGAALVEFAVDDGLSSSPTDDAPRLRLLVGELLPQEVGEERLGPERDDGQDAIRGRFSRPGVLGLRLKGLGHRRWLDGR